jgi:hypothetical protein
MPDPAEPRPLPDKIILVLYAGKDDNSCLAAAIQEVAPHLSPFVYEVDIKRDPANQDMTKDEPFASLAAAARQGRILAITGGPNCRTFSVLLHRPKPGGGRPLRGRSQEQFWGLPDLTQAEQQKLEDDNLMICRQLALFEMAPVPKPGFLLEHPADPALSRPASQANRHASIWHSDIMKHMVQNEALQTISFDQCMYGQLVAKPTTVATNLNLHHMAGVKCNHPGAHQGTTVEDSGSLARWAWGMNQAIAQAIAEHTASHSQPPGKAPWLPQAPGPTVAPWSKVPDTATYAPWRQEALPDKVETVRSGFKQRPLRDGGGKTSPGRLRPANRQPNRLAQVGLTFGAFAQAQGFCARIEESLATNQAAQPFSEADLQSARLALCPAAFPPADEGQPFHLDLLAHLAWEAGDPDWEYPLLVRQGVPLGVEEPTWTSPGIWPTKEELAGMAALGADDLEDPCSHDNYSSAEDHQDTIEQTYLEERALGMTLGPYTLAEAAAVCGCSPEEICCGALGAREEGDKVRTIHDGTIIKVNDHIRANSEEKTTAPGLQDVMHAIREWHADNSPHLADGKDLSGSLTIMKSDVTKAHRRIKVQQKDWKYMAAKIKDNIWLNKCGTYGIASAQLYWGRMAALLLRLLYFLFPALAWAFVYVDDFILLVPTVNLHCTAYPAILALLALGCPISWKKTMLGTSNIWLGYQISSVTGSACLTPSKQAAICALLSKLIQGDSHQARAILQVLGKLQWTTAICPLMRPFLQPLYAWQRCTISAGRPPHLVRFLAAAILAFLNTPVPPALFPWRTAEWIGASDAGARAGTATIGGWYTPAAPGASDPQPHEVDWFLLDVDPLHHPWAFDKGDPQLRIAALELYGSLLLFHFLLQKIPGHVVPLYLPLLTDNQGNAFSVLNHNTKKWPCSAIMMEICAQATKHNCIPQLEHIKRDRNTWADDLTNHNTASFCSQRQLRLPDNQDQLWLVLPQVMQLHNILEQGGVQPSSEPRRAPLT